MKYLLICAVLSSCVFATYGQSLTPEEVVQGSLDAYNAHEFEKFMSYFHENIEMYELHECEPSVKGIDAVRKRYQSYFEASPDLHSKIENRMVFGNTVIDYEYITGARGSDKPYELIFMYEVEEGKIIRTTAIRKAQ